MNMIVMNNRDVLKDPTETYVVSHTLMPISSYFTMLFVVKWMEYSICQFCICGNRCFKQRVVYLQEWIQILYYSIWHVHWCSTGWSFILTSTFTSHQHKFQGKVQQQKVTINAGAERKEQESDIFNDSWWRDSMYWCLVKSKEKS